MKISLSSMPNQHATKMVDFPRLDGGLNLWEMDYRLDRNQSPEMKNLWWQDGVLQCRDGQRYIYKPDTDLGTGYTCTSDLFWDHAFFHIGTKLYYMDPSVETPAMTELVDGVPENRGTFFRYNDGLFYKNRGAFIKVKYDPDETPMFSASHVEDNAYTPIILMNARPSTGSGDTYQPENRLSPKKTVQYNAAEDQQMITKNGDGSTKVFDLGKTAAADQLTRVTDVYYGSTLVNTGLYTTDVSTGRVTFTTAPPSDTIITFVAKFGVVTYQLPVKLQDTEEKEEVLTGDGTTTEFTLATEKVRSVDKVLIGEVETASDGYTFDKDTAKLTFSTAPAADSEIKLTLTVVTLEGSVTEVKVDGKIQTAGTDYAVGLEKGQVIFVKAPKVSDPPVNNTVEITYSKANEDAMNAIMDCPYAIVYGGSQDVCIVLGGCGKQPNAFFWNGNDSVGMNEAYWPMSFYNLAGDSEDGITGFGKQYGTLVIFKERSLGKSAYSVEDVDDRDSISLTYTAINAKIGCDLPWTIQLIENNLVFCNTEGGVHIVRDSTSALENNIECLSRNVNGTDQRHGLLYDIKNAKVVTSFDDGNHYWVVSNGHAYLWDYLLSAWKDPSWFYFTNINSVSFLRTVDKSYHLDSKGRVTVFERTFLDYSGETDDNGKEIKGGIEKVYQFPPQFFDSYDRLKDILYCIFTLRADTDSLTNVQYMSDYETRKDMSPLAVVSWRLYPRNLAMRSLQPPRFAHVARRNPCCRHVRHFSIRLENNEPAQDLAIISAQIYFRFLGRDR